MTNEETKAHLLKYCDTYFKKGGGKTHLFGWCTDACGYDQHCKFADHRNNNWSGGTHEEFIQFIRDYAESLEVEC